MRLQQAMRKRRCLPRQRLSLAVQSHNHSLVEEILESEPDLDLNEPYGDKCLLEMAIEDEALVKLLLRGGADPNMLPLNIMFRNEAVLMRCFYSGLIAQNYIARSSTFVQLSYAETEVENTMALATVLSRSTPLPLEIWNNILLRACMPDVVSHVTIHAVARWMRFPYTASSARCYAKVLALLRENDFVYDKKKIKKGKQRLLKELAYKEAMVSRALGLESASLGRCATECIFLAHLKHVL